ncbi:hypothetical protein ACOSP7_023783 [Xanthoceras sorbifolium]
MWDSYPFSSLLFSLFCQISTVSYCPLLRKTTSIYTRGYDDFDSKKHGGVGKTTLVKRVIGQVIEDKLFDVMVMTEVTETPDIRKIQGQIADELGLKFHEESLTRRAAPLRDRLKKEKRVLVVLDNIWAQLDLEAVAIPLMGEEKRSVVQEEDRKGRNDDLRQCKILLTSRNLDVLLHEMDTQKNYLIENLSKEEAENLFWKIPVAVEIVKKCGGLPVAITTIATALKKRSHSVWKNALEQLRMSNPRNIKGMDANVYSTIKLSYNFLESEEAKSLFLLCSVFATSGVSTMDLLKYATGWGLFQDVYTMKQRRNRLHTLIDILKASCLLLDSDSINWIKMHDVIHAVSVSIASTDKLIFNIQTVTGLKEILEEKLPKDATVVSLPHGDICELPERFHFLSLPSSLQLLTNLQTLCLDLCVLGDISTIGALGKLEVLSLISSDIEHLPAEIGQLTRLRFFVQWDIDGLTNTSLAELKELSQLTRLEIYLLDAQIMPEDLLIFEKLEKYRILIGDVWEWSDYYNYEASRTLKLKLSNRKLLDNGFKTLLSRTEDLYLHELKGVKNVVYQLNGDGFSQLKHLYVENGPEIQYIISTIGWGLRNVFPKLESLFLHKLVNLEKIHHGRLAIESFNKLRIMKVEKCDRLKYLLSFSMAKNLMQLQQIKESKEQVHQNDRISRVEFTQLRTLTIQCLPRLTSFGFNLFTPKTGPQEIIVEYDPSSFTSLFSQNVVLPSLENLTLSSINIGCTWFDQLPVMSSCCQALTNLTLERCEGLKFLFSFSMVKSLVQLQKLEIRNSRTIEGIINTEALREEEKMIKMVFPKLLTLHLQILPKLARFSSGNSVEFPSLTRLYVHSCPKLKTFLSDSMSAADIRLNKADMHPLFDKKNLKTLVPFSVSLAKLKTLMVSGCNRLTNLITLSTAKTLVQLETIDIMSCEMLEEIIIDMRDAEIMTAEGDKDAAIDKITFSMLNSFLLWNLPNLTSFYLGSNTLECPSLTTVKITKCPRMETFVFPKDISIYSASFFSEQATSSCFQNLTELIMHGYDSLKYVFPSSVAESFAHLKVFKISNCKHMEGIIITEEERIHSTLFPELKQLTLKDLPELKRLCNFKGDSIELPSLSELEIAKCPNMQTFASDSVCADMPTIEESNEANTEETIHSFFDEKVVFPCLNRLVLCELSEMLHLLKGNSQPISDCGNLVTLVPSSVSLQNLETLEVQKCDGLINLVTFSTAKSLEKLKIMKIVDCKTIEEIIVDVGDEIKDVIVFNQLKYLKLPCLSSLTNFCKGNFTIKFPYLQRVLMIECTTFSQGDLSTPKLQEICLEEAVGEFWLRLSEMGREGDVYEDGGCWEGDLNTTIQKLFKDVNAESSEKIEG